MVPNCWLRPLVVLGSLFRGSEQTLNQDALLSLIACIVLVVEIAAGAWGLAVVVLSGPIPQSLPFPDPKALIVLFPFPFGSRNSTTFRGFRAFEFLGTAFMMSRFFVHLVGR